MFSFSQRITFRQFESEVWRIYFGFIKGSLMAITSLLYFFMLVAFFIAQHAVCATAEFTRWVSQWNPEKSAVFQLDAEETTESYPEDSRTHHIEAA